MKANLFRVREERKIEVAHTHTRDTSLLCGLYMMESSHKIFSMRLLQPLLNKKQTQRSYISVNI